MVLAQNSHINQWKLIEVPEISLNIYNNEIFKKSCQKHMLEKGQPLQQMVVEKLHAHMQKSESRSLLLILYKKSIPNGSNASI
jgi:hypothetical protein